MLDKLEIPANQEANFGTVIRGFVHPPTTGLYRFFIAANHQAELWLSTDADSSRIRIIASVPAWSMPRDWNATPQQQSQPIELNASARYYIEVRHKNGGGDNHLAVAWQLPDGTMEAPIPKERLSPAAPVNVPGPAVHWNELPQGAGVHDVLGTADYLGRTFPLSFGVRIPESGARALPAMALLPGLGQTSWPPLPPDRRPFVEIMPRLSPEQSYSQRATIACISAAIDDLCRRYPVDLKQVGMVGVNDGATAVWPVAAKAGELFRGVATIGSGEYRDPQLKDLLRGTRVKIITDIREGIQTDCAHRMNALLEGLDPKPEIVFLGEKELGAGTGADYCLRQAGFYDSVLGTQQSQPAGAPAQRSRALGDWRCFSYPRGRLFRVQI